MIIRKTSDIINVKIGGLVAKISPLSMLQKAEVQTYISAGAINEVIKGTSLAIKLALKDIKGLKNVDGSDYDLEKDDNGFIKDSVIDDLLNAEFSHELTLIAIALLDKIPTEFVDPETGKRLKGVEIITGDKSGKK